MYGDCAALSHLNGRAVGDSAGGLLFLCQFLSLFSLLNFAASRLAFYPGNLVLLSICTTSYCIACTKAIRCINASACRMHLALISCSTIHQSASAMFTMEAYTDIRPSTSQPHLDLASTLDQVDTIFSTFNQVAILHFDLRPGDRNLRPSTNSPLIDHVEPLSLTLTSVTFMRNVYVRFVLPLTAGIVFIYNHWRPSGGSGKKQMHYGACAFI